MCACVRVSKFVGPVVRRQVCSNRSRLRLLVGMSDGATHELESLVETVEDET